MHSGGSSEGAMSLPFLLLFICRLMSMHGYISIDKEGNDTWRPFRESYPVEGRNS